MDGGERCVYFPVCRQNPDAIIRGVWLRHHSCPSARPTPPLLDAYTHVHKLFTSFSGPSHPTLVYFTEFIREPAFRCDQLLIMHLSNTDKTCLYWKKTEASLMSSPVGCEDVRSLWVDRGCCNMYVCCVRERWGGVGCVTPSKWSLYVVKQCGPNLVYGPQSKHKHMLVTSICLDSY